MIRKLASVFSLLLILPACTGGGGEGGGGVGGDSSGLPADAQLGELSPSQQMQLCAWGIEVQGGENQVTECGDGVTADTGTVEECTSEVGAYSDCELSVLQMEDCVLALASEPCAAFSTEACEPVLSCVGL